MDGSRFSRDELEVLYSYFLVSYHQQAVYRIVQLYGMIDCHSPLSYLPIFSLPIMYSIDTYFDNVVCKLLMLSRRYNKTR